MTEQKFRNLKCLVINSDSAGCYMYRIIIPFTELRRYNVDYVAYPYLPRIPEHKGGQALDTFIKFIAPYDLVIIQRCYLFEIANIIRQVCDILGKPFIFETDDDYINIPPHNPCHPEMNSPGQIEKFVQILSMADHVTVTTEELKRVYYKFNKNIKVLPNNVENVHYFKDIGETEINKEGKFTPYTKQGFLHVPSYVTQENSFGKVGTKIIRIGYSCNPTHYEDWKTIAPAFYKSLKKYGNKTLTMYFGDYKRSVDGDFVFASMHKDALGQDSNVISVPGAQYFMYHCNTRNLDIGLAPLECNLFNMSKSPIKAVEYGSWGIPAILPNLITYTRDFTHEKNCLTYNSKSEFGNALETLINEPEVRERLGNNAREYVRNHRLEKLHGQERYEFYRKVVEAKRPLTTLRRKSDAV